MMRSCDGCQKRYQAKTSKSKYCGVTCRTRASRARASTPGPAVKLAQPPTQGALVAATERELTDAGRLDSMLGQCALELARRIARSLETGSAVASMVKQLRETMVDALKGVVAAADPLDEIRARRDRYRSTG